jgi:hypothetical protein
MRPFFLLALLALTAATGCGLDSVLEGKKLPNGKVSLALTPSTVSIPLGSRESFTVTVTRTGEFKGEVPVTVEGAPAGVTAIVSSPSTVNQVSTVTITVQVGEEASVGSHVLTIRGDADPLPHVTAVLILTVVQPPAFTVAVSNPSPTIIRGGLAPLAVRLTRIAFAGPVTLSLDGVPGITAAFGTNPLSVDSTSLALSVSASVAPGTHTATLRGVAAGLADRTVPITVTVTSDAIQLIAPGGVSAAQGSSVSAELLVNRGGYAGPVTLTAENLPAGVSASFQPTAPTGTSATMTLIVGATAAPGNHPITVRGAGTAVPSATTQLILRVNGAGVTLALNPAALSLSPGGTSTISAILTRSNFTGPVTLAVEGTPAGLTVTPASAVVPGDAATLTVSVGGGMAPGQHDVTVRATPEGFPPSAASSATLRVTVAAPSSGNVVLTWSGCTAPNWVAAQDGDGPWVQVLPAGGEYRFAVTSAKGAYAFVEKGNQLAVRYHTQAELTAGPIGMCPPPVSTKVVNGTATHTNLSPLVWDVSFGGGFATTSFMSPSFQVSVTAEGPQDLVVTGFAQGGWRVLLVRDLDIAEGGSLPAMTLNSELVIMGQAGLTFFGGAGLPLPRTSFTGTMKYLTTAACTVNHLHNFVSLLGVPESSRRPDDFHMFTVSWNAAGSVHSATEVFQRIEARGVAMPVATNAPVVGILPGTFKRLAATFSAINLAYTGARHLEYQGSGRWVTVTTSSGYTGSAGVELAMPDLSGVAGWLASFAPAADAAGTWRVVLEGGTPSKSFCTENARLIKAQYFGGF